MAKRSPVRQYLDIVDSVRSEPTQAFLLYGEEVYLQDHFLQAVSSAFTERYQSEWDKYLYHASETSPETIVGELISQSLFSRPKMLVIKEVEDLDEDGKAGLVQYLQNQTSDTALIMITENTRLQTRFLKKLKDYSLPVSVRVPWLREMDAWVQYMLDLREMEAPPEVRAHLIDLAGESLKQLDNELKKLQTYLPDDNRAITPRLLEEFVGNTRTHSVYELQDLLATRALAKVLPHVFSLLEEGASVSYIVLITADFFTNLWMVKEMSRKGKTDGEINKTVFQGRNLVWKYKKILNRYTVQEIQRALILLEEADLIAKTSSALDAKNYLTAFFSEILATREEYVHE